VIYIKSILVCALVCVVIIFLFSLQGTMWMYMWIVICSILAFIAGSNLSNPVYYCSYIGENGFAAYSLSGNEQAVSELYQIDFSKVTDVLSFTKKVYKGFVYQNTRQGFTWLNDGQILQEFNIVHSQNDEKPNHDNFEYWINALAEKHFTEWLVSRSLDSLNVNGYIEFRNIHFDSNKYQSEVFTYLKRNSIIFFHKGDEVEYSYSEIKGMSIKESTLTIEHMENFKKFLFWGDTKTQKIELASLSNRAHFFHMLGHLSKINF